uniref:Cation/H+ exchanger transmembrane domain-containing protein n=1 Tax=Aegilops tauschii subsp. strangulata TaxID=200361 RepID=A0A453AUY2_AEGTS
RQYLESGSSLPMATAAEPDDAVLFAGVSLVLGAACRHLFRGTRVPYTIALLVLGVALGSLEYGTKDGLGKLGAGMRIWANINPDLLLAAFLPALLFESAFSMEAHQIKKCMAQMLLLAGPGVLMSTFLLGTALKLTSPYDWNWETSLLLGGLLSATDPVAVVAVLKELGTSKKLSTIIEGESLMNDGVSVVVYQLFLQMVLGRSFNTGSILMFLSEVSLGAYVECFFSIKLPNMATMLLILTGIFFDQCCSGPCICNHIITMAWLYFQRYNLGDDANSCCQLYCFLYCARCTEVLWYFDRHSFGNVLCSFCKNYF